MKKLNNLLDSIAKPFDILAPWLLRIGLGTSFILHGIGKFPIPKPDMVRWFESMGYMYPELIVSMVALGEVVAGAGIIIGGLLNTKANFFYSNGHLITRLSGGAISVIMIGALLIAHKDWLVTQELFMSEQIFLLILGLYFAIKGNK
jgi:uncharacterized membrane protein YphA (DoxX/SURF4 family)